MNTIKEKINIFYVYYNMRIVAIIVKSIKEFMRALRITRIVITYFHTEKKNMQLCNVLTQTKISAFIQSTSVFV